MRFNFQITSTNEVDSEQWRSLVLDLEKFINSKLAKTSFGSSVDKFHYGFEIFSFTGEFDGWFQQTQNIRRYSWQNKYLLSVGQIDWDKYKNCDKKDQFNMISQSVIESIKKLQLLKKKPKDFDLEAFENSIVNILKEYESNI
jgi:hypothetical protein